MDEIIPRRTTLDLAAVAVAAVAIIALFLRANLRFDNSWDGTAYHLVFAAFRAGILTLDDLTPIKHIQDFYNGFPPLLDLIRGYTWRITGSILILQNFDLVALVALALFWAINFKFPAQWTIIAILSVPLLQIGATTLYVDTFVNCLFAMPVSAVAAAFIEKRSIRRREIAISLTALAIVANTKLQFIPLSALMLAVLCSYQLFCLARERRGRDAGIFLALASVASLAIMFTAEKNLLDFANPLYPMSTTIFGHRFPGTLSANIWFGPEYLDGVPQPLRWLVSIVEFRTFEGRNLAYTIGQHSTTPVGALTVPIQDQSRPPSFAMGGYFAPLVLGLMSWLIVLTSDLPLRHRLRWFAPLVITTVLVAPLPGSNELRYFSFWMLNLIFVCFLASLRLSDKRPMLLKTFLLTMFLSVGMWTGWRYFDFRPLSVQDYIKAHGIDQAITGQEICFEHRNRDPILFTYIFHSSGRYRVVDHEPGERCPFHFQDIRR
jgi:hypothetical protein